MFVPAVADLRSKAQGVKRMLSTEIERTVQQLWAQIFNLDPASISANDHFFQLGSDSITTMHIFFQARLPHISLSISDVPRNKTISSLSQKHFSLPLITSTH
ncbi:hypothetical protein BDW60DRAFT_200783 [Aspergillus nidulans var. acristatus]